MKTTYKQTLGTLSFLALFQIHAQGAFFFPTLDFDIDNGTTTGQINSSVNGQSNDFILGTGNNVSGFFDADEVAGSFDLINFSFVSDGAITVSVTDSGQLSGQPANSNLFFRFNITTDAAATFVDYSFTYDQAIAGDTNNGVVLGGVRANTGNDATLTQSLDLFSGGQADLTTAEFRTGNINGAPQAQFFTPNSANTPVDITTDVTEASLFLAGDGNAEGFGIVNIGDPTQADELFSGFSGTLFGGTDENNPTALGDGSLFAISLNGDFSQAQALIPEPSSTALLGLGGLALLVRRKRA